MRFSSGYDPFPDHTPLSTITRGASARVFTDVTGPGDLFDTRDRLTVTGSIATIM